MSTATVLIWRELIMLAVLCILGAVPACLLGPRFRGAARFAMAPALGMCVGVFVFTDLSWFWPARDTSTLLPLVCVISVAFCLWRWRKRSKEAEAEETIQPSPTAVSITPKRLVLEILPLLVVFSCAVGTATYTLATAHSAGPVGYDVADAGGYIASIDTYENESIATAEHQHGPWSNLVVGYGAGYTQQTQNIDMTPFSAAVDAFFGYGATQTQSAFLLTFLGAGALGIFAAIRYARRRSCWAAVLGGALFGGSVSLQLFFDGSQAAICGISLGVPLIVLAIEALKRRDISSVVLLGLVASGLMAIYPLIVPSFVLGALLLVALLIGVWIYSGRIRTRQYKDLYLIPALVVIAVGLNPVDFVRAARYWHSVLHGGYIGGQPQAPLFGDAIPSWLAQTREIYNLTFSSYGVLDNLWFAIVVPVLCVGLVIVALRRSHRVAYLLPFVAAIIVVASYAGQRPIPGTTLSCTYCIDRNVLPLLPLLLCLIGTGLAVLFAARKPLLRAAGAVVAIALLASVGYQVAEESNLYSNSAFMMNTAVTQLVSEVPVTSSALEIEGFGDADRPWLQQPSAYEAAEEHNWGHVSILGDYDAGLALGYFARQSLSGPQFQPDYGYVLTRFGSIKTQRPVLAEDDGMALEKRVESLDATVDYGVSLSDGPNGSAVLPADPASLVQFVVAGGNQREAYLTVQLRLAPTTATTVKAPGSLLRVYRHGADLRVCVSASGRSPVRTARFDIFAAGTVHVAGYSVSTEACHD